MALSVWQGTIADKTGRIKPGAVLLISDEEHGDLAAVYKDRAGAEPWPAGVVTADEFGFARFYAAAGRYRIQSLALGIDWRDVELGFQQTDQLLIGDGSEGAPAVSFSASADGFYRPAFGQVGVTTSGTHRVTFSSNGVDVAGRVRADDGSLATPAFGFNQQAGLGFYRIGPNAIGVATNGVLAAELSLAGAKFRVGGVQTLEVNEVSVATTVPVRASLGSAAAPSHSFSGDTDTGMYSPGANTLDFSCGANATARMSRDATGSGLWAGSGSGWFSGISGRFVGIGSNSGEASAFVLHQPGSAAWHIGMGASDGTLRIANGTTVPVAYYHFRGQDFFPTPDNTRALGNGAFRWSTVYAATGTINTSDAREKTSVAPMTEAEVAAAKYLAKSIGTYRWLASIQEKGEDRARTHVGLTVQQAIEVMERHGLDPFAYAFICHDEWGEEAVEVEDPEGDIVRTEMRQLVDERIITREEVEVVDGEPRVVTRTETVREPRFELRPVVGADGAPATRRRPEERGRKGEILSEAADEAVMHPVPVMGEVEVRYRRKVTRAAGDAYGLRYDQLAMFIARGFEARLAALEAAMEGD